jgi:hypothetical protein
MDDLSPADRAAVEAFCRAFAFALRRVVGETTEQKPVDLPQPVSSDSPDASGYLEDNHATTDYHATV